MTDNDLTLFCIENGDSTPFSVDIDPSKTKTPRFDDVAADELTLWRVSIPLAPLKERKPIVLNNIDSATELDPTDDLSDVFTHKPPKKTIQIIVQRPPPVHAPVPVRFLTPVPATPSDTSRPRTPLSGDLRTDIKKIAYRFFATGSPASIFLDAYVRGEFKLPVTTAGIKGLPKVLLRGVVESQDSGPSLLFFGFTESSVKGW
ncbi:hypothetical protein BC939DRAFT_480963 [Gamsiella multidivaricata]|uniref:uncharacterized protein n=1 Tax=Gamsiella multidivaricata TaxID=101098 RepID=UPI00222096CE|nr:uncharacterized protein BC939DRAFT_480963 [Gamsiella multidivaricata]KAI7817655.1 hypothetical protein BC939DRAFT_480963 [Gamsiella multidivaricata]